MNTSDLENQYKLGDLLLYEWLGEVMIESSLMKMSRWCWDLEDDVDPSQYDW